MSINIKAVYSDSHEIAGGLEVVRDDLESGFEVTRHHYILREAQVHITGMYAAAIELQAENAALRAKVAELEVGREWLPIDENTPKNTHLLLLAGSTPLIHVGLYDSYLGYWNWCYGEDPTHYMPLPQGLAK